MVGDSPKRKGIIIIQKGVEIKQKQPTSSLLATKFNFLSSTDFPVPPHSSEDRTVRDKLRR